MCTPNVSKILHGEKEKMVQEEAGAGAERQSTGRHKTHRLEGNYNDHPYCHVDSCRYYPRKLLTTVPLCV